MKKKKLDEMKGKKVSELMKLVKDKKLEVLKTQAIIRSGQEKNLKKAKNLKVEIAQLLTIIKNLEVIDQEEKSESK